MESRARYYVGTIALAGCAALLAGCGGGGGGGSDSGGQGTPATIALANHQTEDDTSIEAGIAAAESNFFFGWRQVHTRDILSLTVAITEIYFQYCEGDGTPGQPEVVIVSDFEFDPPSITIKEGDTVQWMWSTDTVHTITSGDPGDADAGALFDESANGTGSTVELTFAERGLYPYFSSTEADIDAGMAGLVRVKNDSGHHGNGHLSGSSDNRHGGPFGSFGERVQIFSGEFDVDLLSLTDLSQILTTANVPAAEYCRIFIRIENPRLILKRDPDTVITNVQLSSFGRLVLREHFEITEEDEFLVLLDFGGIHLFRFGDRYVMFHRLRADVRVIGAETELVGAINAVDESMKSVQILTDVGETFNVMIDRKTTIFTDDDADDAAPTGAVQRLRFGDIDVGQRVRALGMMDVSAVINAKSIEIDDDDFDTTL